MAALRCLARATSLPMRCPTWTNASHCMSSSASFGARFGQELDAFQVRGRCMSTTPWHGTTILSVRKDDKVAVVGDGQCTMGSIVIKPTARKVRRIGPEGKIVAGFAGATADAFTLLERLEEKIEQHPGQLLRACVSLAKDWRVDKYLRRLDSMLVVCDPKVSLSVTGSGDVLEPNDGIVAAGSGSPYAMAAARALLSVKGLDADHIAKEAMRIAADMCVYTNHEFVVEIIDASEGKLEKTAETTTKINASESGEKGVMKA